MTGPHAISAEIVAVLVAVTDGVPRVLTRRGAAQLPSGAFTGERSLQAGVRDWVTRQTGHAPGYLEQLYTFADSDRLRPSPGDDGGLGRVISVSYLGLARETPARLSATATWRDWYDFFPWEDHRAGAAGIVPIRERLHAWADAAPGGQATARARRVTLAFGQPAAADETTGWNEDLALSRYELLHEAGLVAEATRAGRLAATAAGAGFGTPMVGDHRRILATAVARLRAKIKYRALVFELMPAAFTMLDLQRTIEALAGRRLHKQNFRRLIAAQDLVEETGAVASAAGGRPARLFRFRGAVVEERALAATRLPLAPG